MDNLKNQLINKSAHLLILLLISSSLFSQSPQRMSYQAVIRDALNHLVTTQVGMQISILQSSSTGTPVYVETQTPTPNINGLVTIEIGGGTLVSGNFSTINWANGTYYIKTETDPTGGTNYTIVGTSQLLSVPYALHAKTVASYPETDPVFVAWDKSTGINITASQVSDFQTSVTNNAEVLANTAKNSYPTADQTKLAGIATGAIVGVVPNTPITGATKTKITYDAKGLVTAGTDATTADITASTNKNYVTDAQLTVIGNTSGTNTGDNAVNTQYSGLVTNATHTGDVTGSEALTLATVNSNVGTFNNITINAKGLATAGSNVSYLTSETDPIFIAWDKTIGINITASQVSDFQTSVTNNAAVLANTAKNSYPTADQTKLAGIATGANVGVVPNAGITGATKTKITYDAKGLVTAGDDATTADIASSTDKNYVTDAQKTVIGNTSGTNTGDETTATIKTKLGITTLSGSNTGDQDGSETKVTAGTNVTVAGAGTTASPYVVGQTPGTIAGQIQYWNGTAWVTVAPGSPGQTLTFVNGVPVWIGTPLTNIVANPTTGKIWMDRNLGATQVATSSTDAASYGYLYQWGRGTDGHQIRTSGTTSTLSSTDAPGHGNFIIGPGSPYDWRSPQNINLWQGVSGVNNPCPTGYRIPTDTELDAERASWSSQNAAGAFASPLKLPMAGDRNDSNGSLFEVGSAGYYWSSTVLGSLSRNLLFRSGMASLVSNDRAMGFSVRCIKD